MAEHLEPHDLVVLSAATYASTNTFNYDKKTYVVKVLKVYDADTITVGFMPSVGMDVYKYQVRLLGYDSPEMRSKNPLEKKWAHNLQKYASSLVGDSICRLECEKMDKYGRILGRLYYGLSIPDQAVPNEALPCLNDVIMSAGICKPYGVEGGAGLKKEEWKEADFAINRLGEKFSEFCRAEHLL